MLYPSKAYKPAAFQKFLLKQDKFQVFYAIVRCILNDIGNVIANTIDNKGEDKRNFFGILRAQRGATDLYNISGDSLNLLNEAYKSNNPSFT